VLCFERTDRNSCPQVFGAGVQCTALDFGDELWLLLKIIQCCGKHCSCHLQDEYVMVEHSASFVISSPHYVPLKKIFITSFPQPHVISYWIAACSSTAPISTINSNSPPTASPI
jgi:hypothetical protein